LHFVGGSLASVLQVLSRINFEAKSKVKMLNHDPEAEEPWTT
jgi:hypothetical protein